MGGLGAYIVRRIAISVPVILLLLLLVFALVHIAPGDPVELMFENESRATQEDIDRVRARLGLDRSLPAQYVSFAANALRGDLGTSLHTREPVLKMITDRLPYTIELGALALAFAIVLAVGVGVLAAVNHNRWIDEFSMSFALLGVSIPNFWLGLMLILVFSVILGWLPSGGAGSILHLLMPVLALGTSWAALSTRLVRSSMLDVLQNDYMRTGRSKGVSEPKLVFKHALRNALVPVVTYIGVQIPGIIGGSVITETVFARPGIGRLLVDSIGRRDLPAVQGVVLMVGVVVVVTSLLVDISYAYLDPRIRYD
jgi:peptide/nickel transport system permease protein